MRAIGEGDTGIGLVFLTKEERANVVRPAGRLLSVNAMRFEEPVMEERLTGRNDEALRLRGLRAGNGSDFYGVERENRCIQELVGLDGRRLPTGHGMRVCEER